jgi:hypothetical protein
MKRYTKISRSRHIPFTLYQKDTSKQFLYFFKDLSSHLTKFQDSTTSGINIALVTFVLRTVVNEKELIDGMAYSGRFH